MGKKPTGRCYIVVALLFLVAATPLFGQNVGTVRGEVRTADGEPVPGVQVEVTGELVRGERTATTGASGEYLFAGLPPGTVTVTATLGGMETATQEDVRVSISGAATVNLTLRPEGVAEEIVVTSEAPILDVTSSSVSRSYGAELIEQVPTTQRNYIEFVAFAPGILSTGRASNYGVTVSAYGRDPGSVSWNVDGLAINHADFAYPFGGYLDPQLIAEYQVLGVGAPAEYGEMTGAAVNVVTKSGTNNFHIRAAYQGEFDSTTATGPKVAGPTGEETGFERVKLTDYVLSSGGALIKDKLFYFFAASYKRDQLAEPGEAAGAVRGDETSRYNLKLDWSINSSNTLTLKSQYEDFEVSANYSAATDAYTVPEALGHDSAYAFPTAHVNFQSVLSSSTFFELSGNEMGWNDRFGPISDSGATAPVIDYTVFPAQSLGGTPYPFDYPTWYVRGAAKLTHFADDLAGSHEFKFGVQYSRSGVTVTGLSPGFSGKYYFKYAYYGPNYPYWYVYAREPHYYGSKEEALGVFVDDSWRIGERLTLNVGVRADTGSGDIPAFPVIESYPGPFGTGVPSDVILPAYNDVVDYDSVDPRIGLAYQVGEGTRQGVLRASYGRYHETNVAAMWSGPHPNRPPSRNGFSANRYGPFYYYRTVGDGNFDLPDPNMKRPETDQYALGYDQQLGNFVVGAQIVISETTDLIGWEILGDGVYEDVPFVNPLTGETIILKNIIVEPTTRKSNSPGPGANVPPGTDYWQEYEGYFLTFAKRRGGGRWSLDSSLGWSESRGQQPLNLSQSQNNWFYTSREGADPNHHIFGGGLGQNDRTWAFKTQALFDLPWQLQAAVIAEYKTGRPYALHQRVSLNQGLIEIPLEPLGDRRLPDVTLLDLALSRHFSLGNRLGFSIDLQMLNVLDEDAFTSWRGYRDGNTQGLTPNRYYQPRRMSLRLTLDF